MSKVKEFIGKNKIFIAIVVVLLIVAIVIAAVTISKKVSEKKEREAIENTINSYMESFNSLDGDKMLETIDSKAAYAWSQCEGTESEKESGFKKAYDETSDDNIKTYENNLKSELKMLSTMYNKYLDYYKVELVEIKDITKVKDTEGLIKVKAKTKTTFSYQSKETTDDSDVIFYLYNGKIVTMDEDSSEETESTDENKVEENTTEDNKKEEKEETK